MLAILATISLMVYAGIQNRAHNTAVQSDLKNIATRIEMYHAEQGVYPDAGNYHFSTLGVKATKSAYNLSSGIHSNQVHNLLYCVNPNRTQFTLIARAKSGDAFQYATGSAGVYTGPLQSNDTLLICGAAGVTVVSSLNSDWIWFYEVSAWKAWLQS